MLTVDIRRDYTQGYIPNDTLLSRWANSAYVGDMPGEVSILITDTEQTQTLNNRYRHQNQPTNVLSFPAELDAIDGLKHLGDIVLCAPYIEREAQQQGKPNEHHWAHLTIHGMLHLQGYDHITESDALHMETLESTLLATLSIPDPYQPSTNQPSTSD